jgi:hypothetical protein
LANAYTTASLKKITAEREQHRFEMKMVGHAGS